MNFQPYEIVGADRPSHYLFVCDHAANTVPPFVNGGDLGLSPEDMARHIAWDVGAAGVTRRLAERLDAPAILSNFSRLVIDPNRGEDDPTLVMKLYDGSVIPANRHADAAEVERRLDLCYRPYHAALERLILAREAPVIISIHSFTPRLIGRPPRPWHVGVLYSHDAQLARPLIARLRREPDLCVGDNEPYSGHLTGDTMDRHGVQPNRCHALIELRNDLIADTAAQHAWADRLAPILDDALAAAAL
ncbi:N-formylglutamate amidohydrolase [Maritimibacter sp. 55A14]|uniref:N-formylglutamate amidohydrolase n=1 Tax=Maritimibacter sp. 55A14 TaxID=2174844 RepID=UPI001E36DECA|nr:N-formylglutamate amidohydrolase [Maritimibacter sp. 55A14]